MASTPMHPLHALLEGRVLARPALSAEQAIVRQDLLDALAQSLEPGRVSLISARAGQGKTLLAAQLAGTLTTSSCWFRASADDVDPVILLWVLYQALVRSQPSARSSAFEQFFARGDSRRNNLHPAIAMFLDAMRSVETSRLVFFVDDAHVLSGAPAAISLLVRIITHAPQPACFVMTSRVPAAKLFGAAADHLVSAQLSDDDLSLTSEDIEEILAQQSIPIDPTLGRAVKECTGGWPLGVGMMCRRLRMSKESADRESMMNLIVSEPALESFIETDLLESLDPLSREALYKAALLSDANLRALESIAEQSEIAALTASLADSAGVAKIDDLHPLVLSHLRRLAPPTLGEEHCRELRARAASWYLRHNHPLSAIRLLVEAGLWTELDRTLSTMSMQLLALGLHSSLARLLGDIEEPVLAAHGWVAVSLGLARIASGAPTALLPLELANSHFRKTRNAPAQLLAIANLVYFHGSLDGEYARAADLLVEAHALFSVAAEELPPLARIPVSAYLGGAELILNADYALAHDYLGPAERAAMQADLPDAIAQIRYLRLYELTLRGPFDLAFRELEGMLALASKTRVSEPARALIVGGAAVLLAVSGRHEAFLMHCAALAPMLDPSDPKATVMSAYLARWQVDVHLALGKLETADRILRKAMSLPAAMTAPHLRSQFLQYAALVAALSEKPEQARSASAESRTLREQVWDINQRSYNAMRTGVAHLIIGDHEEGLTLLDEAWSLSERMEKWHMLAGIAFYRAFAAIERNEDDDAASAIAVFGRIMDAQGLEYFDTFLPGAVRVVATYAVRRGLEVERFRALLAARLGLAIDDSGECFPLLKVSVLGPLAVQTKDAAAMDERAFTPIQRRLLTVLALAPSAYVDIATVLLELWPEKSTRQARASFDTTIARLRKTLSEVALPREVGDYLSVQRELLCLHNCELDTHAFRSAASLGLKQAAEGQPWLAMHTLGSAVAQWRGPLPKGLELSAEFQHEADRLQRLFVDAACTLAKLLGHANQGERAIDIVRRALALDPTDDRLVGTLYQLLIRQGRLANAREALDRYLHALSQDGFTASELEAARIAVTGAGS